MAAGAVLTAIGWGTLAWQGPQPDRLREVRGMQSAGCPLAGAVLAGCLLGCCPAWLASCQHSPLLPARYVFSP